MEVPIISITSQKEAGTGTLTINLKSLKSTLLKMKVKYGGMGSVQLLK